MVLDDYRVRLDAFEGPLDLLLFLIRKAEVDIHNIPIASITEQYLAHVEGIRDGGGGRLDIDTAGEFIVMAATLMEIKSRMLMPRQAQAAGSASAEPAEDPRAELVRQLLDYKRYRDASEALEVRAEEWRRRFPVSRAGISDEALQQAVESAADLELEDLGILDLAAAFRRIAETVNFDRLGEHEVTYDDTPIEVHAEELLATISAEPVKSQETDFAAIFRGKRRSEMLGMFLALLELVRKRRVAVRQDPADGRIFLRLREPEADVLPDVVIAPGAQAASESGREGVQAL